MRKTRLILIAALLPLAYIENTQAFEVEPITVETMMDSSDLGTPRSTIVTVEFGNQSSVFKPSFSDTSILADAKNAALITVRGRTSTPIPSAKDEALALMRAISARKYLVEHGISPLKVNINYASGADFVTNNITPEEKQQNQRVEIELVYVNALPNY